MNKRKTQLIAVLLLCVFVCSSVLSYGPKKVKASSTIKVTVKHPDLNTVKLTWGKVSEAVGYHVYYSKTKTGVFELIATAHDTSIIINELTTDVKNYFKVVAYTVEDGMRVEQESSDILEVRSNRIGIDVSKYNGTINWAKVKAAGIEYAIVRTSYGLNTALEPKFKEHMDGATKAGVPVGVYIYSTASNVDGAKKEAELVLQLVKGYKLSYPICFDIEGDTLHSKTLSKRTNTEITKAFMDTIQKAGYKAMLYTGCSFSRDRLYMNELTQYDWWIPHYGSSSAYAAYSGKYHFSGKCYYYTNKTRMWQYSEYGKVDGISTRVDMNYELDLKESTTGIPYVSLKTRKEHYVAGKNETIKSIAEKLGISIEGLLNSNPTYKENSSVGNGKSLTIDTLALVAPELKTDLVAADKIMVSNGTRSLIDEYELYHSTSLNGTYKKIATTTSLPFTHVGASKTATNYYKVAVRRTVDGIEEKAVSHVFSKKTSVSKPTNVKSVSNSYNSNKVTWNKVTEATGYYVYSSTSKNGTYKLVKTTTGTSFTHTGLQNKKTYYYKVKAYAKGIEKNVDSSYSGIASSKPVQAPATSLKAVAATNNSIKISWTKASGANSYKVYRATSKNGTYKRVATVTGASYTNKSLTKNKTYYYKVLAVKKVGTKEYTSTYTSVISAKAADSVKLSAPKIKTITGYTDKVYMTWSSVSKAKGYEIYRATSKNGSYKKVTTKSPTYINNIGLNKNTTYYYKVRAYNNANGVTTYSPYSSILSVKTKA